ncbi:MAG: hypothetical protein GF313_04085 [Caldithrix sp.]|nr:hypothetical protein [Caldithrix sp.]
MNYVSRYLLIVLLLCGWAWAESFEKSYDTKAGQTLEIDLQPGGSIDINGWDRDQLQIKVSYDGDRFSEDLIDIKEVSDGFRVNINHLLQNHGSADLHLHVNVPRQYNLKIETMGGSITIHEIEGDMEGKTMGGSLKLSQLKGTINMTTMGGSIRLVDSYDLDGSLKTMGGNVNFTNVVGSVDGTTMGGNVNYTNVSTRKGDPKGDEVKISTMGGEINVDQAQQGADVHTMGGSIHVKKAKVYVKAKTMGGDINIDEVDGWVKATTMGGDINIKMVGDGQKGKRDVYISSMGGVIDLTLPANISADFDVKLTYTRDSSQDFEIDSDFDMTIEEESDEWSYRNGSPRKVIRGKGSVGGGKNTIHIETINGDVRIKKGS